GGDGGAFDRCGRWHRESGLPVGISVVPASDNTPEFYAQHATRLWEATAGRFILGLGSGSMPSPATNMPAYIAEVRKLLPVGLRLYLAALGPLMLQLGGEVADGVLLNWCSEEMVQWSRDQIGLGAARAHRAVPVVAEYVRVAVDSDPKVAKATLSRAALGYAIHLPQYRRHFERMGFGQELDSLDRGETSLASDQLLAAAGGHGTADKARAGFERLSVGLDLAIVRALANEPGDAVSIRGVLEACSPDMTPA
ncbi:MAG TPA: LLM class flavin-dependent oxidoreductase, partial [Candidatus Dormibacteraeota bacterium]|nr:LLM class flavin-dependent oxidoreductase [Candidatus Dormibacteraeota bacterium]